MKHQLRQEIENLIKRLHDNSSQLTEDQLYERLRTIYELGVLLKHGSKATEESSVLLGEQQAQLFASLESMAIEKEIPPSESFQEQQEEPELMDTIKNMVTEMPESKVVNELFTQIEEPHFVRKEAPEASSAVAPSMKDLDKPSPNLNERFSKGLKVDLNDRLAFIQHLFDNKPNDYQRALNQLTTFDNFQEVSVFIESMIKPDYNNWEGKELYEERFLGILSQFFETKE